MPSLLPSLDLFDGAFRVWKISVVVALTASCLSLSAGVFLGHQDAGPLNGAPAMAEFPVVEECVCFEQDSPMHKLSSPLAKSLLAVTGVAEMEWRVQTVQTCALVADVVCFLLATIVEFLFVTGTLWMCKGLCRSLVHLVKRKWTTKKRLIWKRANDVGHDADLLQKITLQRSACHASVKELLLAYHNGSGSARNKLRTDIVSQKIFESTCANGVPSMILVGLNRRLGLCGNRL